MPSVGLMTAHPPCRAAFDNYKTCGVLLFNIIAWHLEEAFFQSFSGVSFIIHSLYNTHAAPICTGCCARAKAGPWAVLAQDLQAGLVTHTSAGFLGTVIVTNTPPAGATYQMNTSCATGMRRWLSHFTALTSTATTFRWESYSVERRCHLSGVTLLIKWQSWDPIPAWTSMPASLSCTLGDTWSLQVTLTSESHMHHPQGSYNCRCWPKPTKHLEVSSTFPRGSCYLINQENTIFLPWQNLLAPI